MRSISHEPAWKLAALIDICNCLLFSDIKNTGFSSKLLRLH